MDQRDDEARLLRKARGAWATWELGDDLCPPWWPRRARVRRRGPHAADLHLDLRAADSVYTALTLLATTFQFRDEGLVREVRAVALAHVRAGAQILARGATRAWEPGDDVCPPFADGAPLARPAAANDAEAPAGSIPDRAMHLLDGLALLQVYHLAAKLPQADARAATTTAIGQALVAQAATVAGTFG
jgi:hypothetical protein